MSARGKRAGTAVIAILALAAAGCASSTATGGSSARSQASTVTIELTPQGCTPKSARIAAGQVQFNVTNSGAGAVSEAELRTSDSKMRAAIAQADSIADNIAFQVTDAYRHLITARRGIDRSRPAVTHAEDNYRLVKLRAGQGEATSAEITDAESALTRAQQDYLNSIHDCLIALVRLEYAMGVTVSRVNSCGSR